MEETTKPFNPNARWKKLFSREYAVQYTEVSLRSLSPEVNDIQPFTFYEQIYIPEENNQTCYADENKWNNFLHSIQSKWGTRNVKPFYKLFIKTGNLYVNFTRKISKKNIRRLSNEQLKEVYLQYQKILVRYSIFIWLAYFLNEFHAEKARQLLQKKVANNDLNDYFDVVFAPLKKAAIIELTDSASSNENIDKKLMFRLYRKFSWIPCLDLHNKPWTFEEFKNHIADFRKKKQKPSMTYNQLLKKIKASDNERKILDAAKLFAYIKDKRDDFRRQGICYIQSSLFREIADRMKLDLHQLSYAQEKDIVNFLDNGVVLDDKVINQRKKGFVVYFNSRKEIICASGEDIKNALKKLGFNKEEENFESIKGMSASKGTAQGRVVIVKGVKDLPNINKGDVLVAVTTHPDYVPAMQKAVAIVTDEGGVTSHAAIVSREFGIPCIVGTKTATKTLNDGDYVEVDGSNGMIKILKKKA